MNNDLYDAGRSYNQPPNKTVSEKELEANQKAGGNKVTKSTETFRNLAVSIANKAVSEITAEESKKLMSKLRSRTTGQTGDPGRGT